MNKLTALMYPGENLDCIVIECVEVPVCTQGDDRKDALRMLKEAVSLYLKVMAEREPAIYQHYNLDSNLMEQLSFEVVENKP